ncbi:MAG: hypothetical protein AB7T59_08385 [Hyphomonadaceae bacterium]
MSLPAQGKGPLGALKGALEDLGYFYGLFTLVVSGPSIISLLQTIFIDHRLVDALQWIVDGYNDIAAAIGSICEPLIAPLIAWINAVLALDLNLQPHWRPLFLLLLMFALGVARAAWSEGARLRVIPIALVGGFGALAGAVIAGLLPLSGGWPAQAIIAGAPVLVLGLFATAPTLIMLDPNRGRDGPREVDDAVLFPVLIVCAAAVAAMVGGMLTGHVPLGAGIAGLGAAVLLIGLMIMLAGLTLQAGGDESRGARGVTRYGLILIGGFATAGLILAADAVIKALTAA